MARASSQRPPRLPASVVALGASAGGLESLGHVLAGLPPDFPAPVLVALHLDPHHASQAVPILQQRSQLPVHTATSGVKARAGRVYVAPPDRHLTIRDGKVLLTRAARVSFSRPSVDVLFASIAKDFGPGAIAVVLSGTGRDGAAGVAAVRAKGGLALAEHASTANFDGMPSAAARAGALDAILPVHQIPAFLVRAASHRVAVSQRQWDRILGLLEAKTGSRFGRYRASTLHRRLQHRMATLGCKATSAYLDILEDDAGEVARLHAAFLIKVSAFARDPASWKAVARRLKPLAASRSQVRAWSAGCATGEEAYTIAMLLARTLGMDGIPWKVFATDVDEGALKVGRAGLYTEDQVEGVPPADRKAYFVRAGETWRVGKALRSRVVFGRHDLLHDPPLDGIDVLACRNVLIYFKAGERKRVVDRLASVVTPGGILFLGRSEGMRPVPGFDRVGGTTFFRRAGLGPVMPKGTKGTKGTKATKATTATKGTKGTRGKRMQPDAHGAAGDPQEPGPSPIVSIRPKGAGHARARQQQDLNEELQSRNEELETVNEELQSLNDELSTMEEHMRGLGEEAKRANDFLRLLLDTSSDVLVACDGDNKVTFWNKAAVKRFRLSPMQAVGGELFDLVPALDTPALRAASDKARKAGRGGRVAVTEDGAAYVFDPLPDEGKRRRYLLRVRPA